MTNGAESDGKPELTDEQKAERKVAREAKLEPLSPEKRRNEKQRSRRGKL